MIEINDKTYIKTVWFFDVKHTGNWMAVLLRQEGEKFSGINRFRTYRKEAPDFKTWGTVTENLSVREIDELFDDMANKMENDFFNKAPKTQKLEINEYGQKSLDILFKQPWFKKK